MDGRTYTKTAIRERRLALQRQLALQQRELEALAKMDEAADELERIESEREALSREETQFEQPDAEPESELEAEPDQPVRAAETKAGEPQTTGQRAEVVLKDQVNTWLEPRDVLAGMGKRGWIDTDINHALQRLRHSLRRLATSNPHIERDESGATYRYRYVLAQDGDAMPPGPPVNGTTYPTLQKGLSDG